MVEDYLFTQLDFVRKITLKAVDGISEDVLDTVHTGFRNNIRWNLGHIYVVQERFGFHLLGLPTTIPASYPELFAMGTSPLNWIGEPPAISEINQLLSEQPDRIRAVLEHRLDEILVNPYTTSSGLALKTVKELMNFTLYHEGMHFSCIKIYKALSTYSKQ